MKATNTVGVGTIVPAASHHVAGKFLSTGLTTGVLMGMDSTTNTTAKVSICAGSSSALSLLDFSYTGQASTGNPGSNTQGSCKGRISVSMNTGLMAFYTQQTSSAASTPYRLYVTGNSYLNGSLTLPSTTSGTIGCYSISTPQGKAFDIPHPTREGWRLRHRCAESDRCRLFYEYTLECQLGLNTVRLPEWHASMNEECRVYCSPFRHFGAAWGEVVGDELRITTNAPGAFHVYLTGVRCDEPVKEEWARHGVEYEASPPEIRG